VSFCHYLASVVGNIYGMFFIKIAHFVSIH
jgi:hypothetical protein